MNKAVWFSRHTPTDAQIADMAAAGVTLVDAPEGIALGSTTLTDENCDAVIRQLVTLAKASGARRIYGVFSTHIMAASFDLTMRCVAHGDCYPDMITLFAAYNAARTPEGGAATFQHAGWKAVGVLA